MTEQEPNSSRTLGKYQIIDELGRGGFATVYRSRDLDLGREVALKVLDPLLSRDPVWVTRFRQEARAIAALDHPRIVTVYDVGQAEGALYITMKLVEGGSLADRLREQGALPWDEVLRWTGEIAEALDFAHGQGVLHRDLKPANVLLDPRVGAVLTDFGFARLVADHSLSVSLSGGLVGTPAYIAPESWEGKKTSTATDVYALGCIVYEMATGQQRFSGDTPPAVMLAHFQPPPLPDTWPEGVPPRLGDVLAKALARNPDDRYQGAGELAVALLVDPLAAPYQALQDAVAAGAWQEALALADQIWEQSPGFRDTDALELQALAGVEAAARREKAAQWRAAAELGLADNNPEAAHLAVLQWQQAWPDDLQLVEFQAQLAQADDETTLAEVVADSEPTPESAKRPWAKWLTIALLLVALIPIAAIVYSEIGNSTSALDIGSTMISEKDGMELVYVPAGEFTMGSSESEVYDDEHPQHTVYLDGFWIDRTEVTAVQYRRCVEAGECSAADTGDRCTYGATDKANHPVNCVDWSQATAYCSWVGRRLPTEAEWEKAARGGDARAYPWGDSRDDGKLNSWDASIGATTEVGSYPEGASPYEALDMAGNVWEWVADWYDADYYADSPAQNPLGPGIGSSRVLRGGSWYNVDDDVRAASRGRGAPDNRDETYGFRCARL